MSTSTARGQIGPTIHESAERVNDIAFTIVNDRSPGRLRIAVVGLFRCPEHEANLCWKLRSVAGIIDVEASSLTGRALIIFDRRLAHSEIASRIKSLATSGGQANPVRSSPSQQSSGSQLEPYLWHSCTPEEVLARFGSCNSYGLTTMEVQNRRAANGLNATTERPPASSMALLLDQFMSLPVGLLVAASVVSIATGGFGDATITIAVIVLNAGIGFATESGSDRIIRSMTKPFNHRVEVVRDGVEVFIAQVDIVPGDILVLKPNAVVAADARLISSEGLLVNEALLTGESEPVDKRSDCLFLPKEPVGGRRNMVHAGSFVVSGSGRAVVVATGDMTETGRIEQASHAVATPMTPLERDLNSLGSQLALVSIVACGAFFVAGYVRGRTLFGMFKSAVALAVAAVPEGLPATATTTLALGLRELRRRGVIVRRLEAVEAMGCLEVICFDKTGTLTQNRMQLARLQLGDFDRPLDFSELHGAASSNAALAQIHAISILCSELLFEKSEGSLRQIGSSTEAALAEGAIKHGTDPLSLRRARPLISLQYRSETKRYMASRHGGREPMLAVKGDPLKVLALSTKVLSQDGRVLPMTEQLRCRIQNAAELLAADGYRVLGFGYREGELNAEVGELIWAGAAALDDPLADGAAEVIKRLHAAGIRTVMITGDQAATAEHIARTIRLSGNEPLRVLDSVAIDSLPTEALSAVAQRTHVFARVPSTKKLHIVKALQSAGMTVGMIGDGFNDAPALKAANVAIAVGEGSTSAARDVADVILAEQRLSVIGDGVEQGRTILSNIRKTIHYMISTNLSEILVLLAETLRQDDQLESPMELLWLNLVTDVLPGLGLALEDAESDVMLRPPRSSDDPLLSMADLKHAAFESVVISAAALAAHGYGLARYGPGPQTRSVTFFSLVFAQLMHAFACRHDRFEPLGGSPLFGNRALNFALLGSAAMQVVPIVSPSMQRFLGIAAPRLGDLAVAGTASMAAFAVNEFLQFSRTPAGSGPKRSMDTQARRRGRRGVAP